MPALPQSRGDKKERVERCPVDMTQWHNFAFEWTSGGRVGYVDGVEWCWLSGGPNAVRRTTSVSTSGDNIYDLWSEEGNDDVDGTRIWGVGHVIRNSYIHDLNRVSGQCLRLGLDFDTA